MSPFPVVSRWRFVAAGLSLCGLAFWLRLVVLDRLPVFVDEGTHLDWAHQVVARLPDYPWLMHGKLLLGLGLALFQVPGPAALWVGRASVAVLTIPACAASVAVGARLAGHRVGLLAGLVYAVWPFTIFHERQILADPVAAACGAMALACGLRFAHTRRWRWGWPVPILLALAILFKLTGAVALVPLGLAPLLLASNGAARRWWLFSLGWMAAATGAVVGLALLILRPWWGSGAADLVTQQVGFIGCPPLLCQGDWPGQLALIQVTVSDVAAAANVYLGWPGVLLAAAAPLLVWRGAAPAQRHAVIWLWASVAGMLLAFVSAAALPGLPPRYFLPAAMPIAVLVAWGWLSGIRLVARRPARWVAGVGLALGVLLPVTNLAVLVPAPTQARLPPVDRAQYVTGPYAGVGLHEAAAAILQREAGAAIPPRILVNHYLLTTLAAYFDRTRVDPVIPLDASWQEVTQTLALGGRVYLVDQIALREAAEPAGGVQTDLYPRMNAEQAIRVQAFADLTPESLPQLYAALFGGLDFFRSDYQALTRYVAGQQPSLGLLTYPGSQSSYLRELSGDTIAVNLLAAETDTPWSVPATLAAFEQAAAGRHPLAVAFLQETRLDPAREVETWLVQHWFRASEQWFGPVRLVTYAGPRPAGSVIDVGARFGDAVVLEGLELVDTEAAPGDLVRLRLYWRAVREIHQQLRVFAHLYDATGIVAQHDGQPVGELRPTTTWLPGESIVDQFAIQLPPAVPPGRYHLRLGLYAVDSQQRLTAHLADGTEAEFYAGGEVAVR